MSGRTFPASSTVRHGTHSGWQMHKRLDRDPCDACYRAKQDYDRNWRAAPEQTRLSRMRAVAQRQALRRLKDRHPTEYAALYAEEFSRVTEARS